MEIKCAKISNQSDNNLNPFNAAGEIKGQRGVCCLSVGVNIPATNGGTIPEKVTEIIVESYMRRPSLSNVASDEIFKRANDSVLMNQSPQYPSTVSASAVFVLKNKYVCCAAGDNYIFHFVDGVLADVFTGSGYPELGNLNFYSPVADEEKTFAKGENTFLICSAKFAQSFSEGQIEDELIRATYTEQKGKKTVTEVMCDRWLQALWDSIPNKYSGDDYSAIAISFPPKKKSTKMLVIAIAAAVVVLVGIFLAVGFFTRRPPQGPQPGEPGVVEPSGPPGSNIERPTGPNGEIAPDPPTRPAQN